VVTKATAPAARLPVDCFYVYPTVSRQTTANADLTIDPEEMSAASAQVARFSSVCNVWAPMYRQRTVTSLAAGLGVDAAAGRVAYNSLHAAWLDYLANDNAGRPVVFIGHSQGAAILINLLQAEVDQNPTIRARVVSAILLGGNVTVPAGKDVGATFQNLPACRAATQTGCVIAYSSFPSTPPADALFGIPGRGVSLQSGQIKRAGVQVLCTNPAALGGGSAPLDPYFWVANQPARKLLTTDWVEYPALYTATCKQAGEASWLDVAAASDRADTRTRVAEALGARWGYHLVDVNLALGNLVSDVQQEIATYQAAH